MNKIHVTVNVGDEIFDEAALQILKKKVREQVQCESSDAIKAEVRRMVDSEIHDVNRSFYRTKTIQRAIEDRLESKLAERAFQDEMDAITKRIVSEYTKKAVDAIASFDKSIPKMISDILLKSLQDSIFVNAQISYSKEEKKQDG
ncbi:MAG: hypothetical protein IJ210_15180 [Clostridia bacterium]|nr:hypothetical protein [Clostridia bacterium]